MRAIRLQHALGAQILHLRLAEAEPAEDLGVVLAELGGDGAHPHTLADLDRGADVRDLAQFRVARVLNEAHLRVVEHLGVIVDRARAEHRPPRAPRPSGR